MSANPAPGSGQSFEPVADQPQTNTDVEDNSTTQNDTQTNEPTIAPALRQILTDDQFEELVKRLSGSASMDKAPAPSMTPGQGLQVNPFGAVVGTVTKYNVDPNYYPNPVERLYDDYDNDQRTRRLNLRENYFITWDISSKPYETKDNLMVQEPTFHLTLYMNMFDEEGVEIDRAIIVQTLHLNEDEQLARIFAAERDLKVTDKDLKNIMDETRYSRIKAWLDAIFFPPRNFELVEDAREEAIGGSVVKVVTKSNVKGFGNKPPTISDEELQ